MARDPCFRRGGDRGTDVAPANVESNPLNIEKKRIQEAPEYKPDADFTREYETKLHDYYRFPYYWL